MFTVKFWFFISEKTVTDCFKKINYSNIFGKYDNCFTCRCPSVLEFHGCFPCDHVVIKLCGDEFISSGIGWGMVLISAMVCVYYNIIIMYALLYIFLSLVNIGWAVPWASCRNAWNKREVCLETPLPDLDSYTAITDRISHSLGESMFIWHYQAGTWRRNDIILASIWRYYDA